jgi:methylmalonyl-CoA mutase
MFLNTAIDAQLGRFTAEHGRAPSPDEADAVRAATLQRVRGTVQADILKEDQGQNTCIFSTEFSLRVMADIQEWFIQHDVRNFYSVSISGYHIAEAGANPISQLAFTLSNGFTYVESYLAHEAALWRQRSLAKAEVSHPDVGSFAACAGDGVQRHSNHLAGPVRHL